MAPPARSTPRHRRTARAPLSGLFIYLGIGSLFKAFCSSLFTTSLSEAHTHFWGGKTRFFGGGKLHFCSAITQKCHLYFTFRTPAGAVTLPPPPASQVSCLGQGPSGFFLHLPEIKPGLFHPKHEPFKRLFCVTGAAANVPRDRLGWWPRLPPGTGQGPALCWNKSELLPGNADPSLANTTC